MPASFEINPNFCFAMLCSCVVYLWTRPPRAAWLAVLLLAAAMRFALLWRAGTLGAYYGVSWISWGPFLGMASLLVLAWQITRSPAERRALRQTFHAAAILPLCSLVIAFALPLTIRLRPLTYDAYLLAFDGGLGFQPSFVLGRCLLLRSANLWGPTTVAYYSMTLAVGVLYASYRLRPRQPVAILALFLSLILTGIVLYVVFPAVGPLFTARRLYPMHPPSPGQIPLRPMTVPDVPRNCMPSVHFAAALLVWWNGRFLPRLGRLLAFLFVLTTLFDTLALGEHYLVDLVVAFPFTLALQAVWTRSVEFSNPVRQRSLWLGAALTAAWMIALRYCLAVFLISPAISWGLIVLTVGGCMLQELKLSAAAAMGKRWPSELSA